MMNKEISNLIKPQKEILLNPMQMAAVLANHRYKIPYITIEASREADATLYRCDCGGIFCADKDQNPTIYQRRTGDVRTVGGV